MVGAQVNDRAREEVLRHRGDARAGWAQRSNTGVEKKAASTGTTPATESDPGNVGSILNRQRSRTRRDAPLLERRGATRR